MSNIDFDNIRSAVDIDDTTVDIKVKNELGTEVSMKLHFATKAKKTVFIGNINESGHVDVKNEVNSGVSKTLQDVQVSMSDADVPIYMKVFHLFAMPVELIIAATVGW